MLEKIPVNPWEYVALDSERRVVALADNPDDAKLDARAKGVRNPWVFLADQIKDLESLTYSPNY